MLIQERWEDPYAVMQAALSRVQSRMWTSLPCEVVSVDADRQTVTVRPTVMGAKKLQDPNTGTWSWVPEQLPDLPMVPIKYPSGGGWTLTFPIAPGDEGTVVFSSRCIDNWWQQGGVQPILASNGAGSLRMHDLSDGFFELGGRSQPNYLNPTPSATSVELRSDTGDSVVSFDSQNGFQITLNGSTLQFDTGGNLHVPGNIYWNSKTTPTDAAGHEHSGVSSGTSNSGPPVPGS